MFKFFSNLILLSIISGCTQNTSVKVEDLSFVETRLDEKEEVRIIMTFPERGCTQEKSYVRQIIVRQEGTGDTIRILAPCQTEGVEVGMLASITPLHKKRKLIEKAITGSDFQLNLNKDNLYISDKTIDLFYKTNQYKTVVGFITVGN